MNRLAITRVNLKAKDVRTHLAYIMLDEKPVGKVALRYAQTVEQEKQPEKKPFWKRWFGGGT